MPTQILLYLVGCMMLVNTNLFYYASMTQYFAFCTASIIFWGMGMYQKVKGKEWHCSTHVELLFFVWVVYVVSRSFFGKNEEYNLHYLFALWMFYQGTVWLIRRKRISVANVSTLLILLSSCEAIVCLLQWMGITESQSALFTVTGTWESPNVTAMFMTLGFPFVLGKILYTHKRYYQWGYSAVMILLIIALLLINCRTAYISAFLSTLILCSKHFQWNTWLRRVSAKQRIGISLLVIGVITASSFGLYKMKQASADGRLFIWKTTLSIITEKPIAGHGYGLFEKEYNLHQSRYFQEGQGTVTERKNARHVFMCYNDYLGMAVEGGILASLLYLAVLIITLYRCIRIGNHIATACLINLLWMSSVNFVLQAVPLMFASILIIASVSAEDKLILHKTKIPVFTCMLLGCMLLIEGGHSVIKRYTVQRAIKQAMEIRKQNPNKALSIMEKHKKDAETSECFWRIYGKMCLYANKYEEAHWALNTALQYTSSPIVIKDMIICYQKLGLLSEAKKWEMTLQHIAPSVPYRKILE